MFVSKVLVTAYFDSNSFCNFEENAGECVLP